MHGHPEDACANSFAQLQFDMATQGYPTLGHAHGARLSCARFLRSVLATRATRLLSLCERSEREISKLSNLGQYTALPESITIAGFCEY